MTDVETGVEGGKETARDTRWVCSEGRFYGTNKGRVSETSKTIV